MERRKPVVLDNFCVVRFYMQKCVRYYLRYSKQQVSSLKAVVALGDTICIFVHFSFVAICTCEQVKKRSVHLTPRHCAKTICTFAIRKTARITGKNGIEAAFVALVAAVTN
jgi:hypothetical protein